MSPRHKLKYLAAATATAASLSAGMGHAQTAPPASPHSFTANVSLTSQYIFRGLTQTNRKPALQGGFDYGHSSGFYAGVWGSNVSWVDDAAETAGADVSSSLELDIYAGYKGSITPDIGFDVGVLHYNYPGSYPGGWVKPNTTELYGGLSWKWLSFKASYSLGDTFGVDDAEGTQYYDLTAAYPVNDQLSIIGHVGHQRFRGSIGGVSNDDLFTYTDWKLEVAYAIEGGWTVGAAYTDTDAEDAGYTILGRNVGKETGFVYVKKTF